MKYKAYEFVPERTSMEMNTYEHNSLAMTCGKIRDNINLIIICLEKLFDIESGKEERIYRL